MTNIQRTEMQVSNLRQSDIIRQKKDDPRCNVNRLSETSISCSCKKHLMNESCKYHSIIKPCFLHWFYFYTLF